MIHSAEKQTLLNKKQLSVVSISAYAAAGAIPELENALNTGLNAGLTVNEIKQILVQLYAYAGFPRSLNALNCLMSVLKERQAKGIKDDLGKEANPLPKNKSLLELGTEVQTKIVGAPVKGELFDFAPDIDIYLKEHLFGAVFGRDNLDIQTRELATVAFLTAMDGVEPQRKTHWKVAQNTGLTEPQLEELTRIVKLQRALPHPNGQMLFRIAEIVVYPQYLNEYIKFVKEVGDKSVNTESGVVCIYPMQVKRNKNQIRIIEIYTDMQAYNRHIQSAHFQKYKQETLRMIKSLDLVDTDALNLQTMNRVFRKVQNNETVYPKGQIGSSDWFNGTVYVQPLVNPPEIENLYSIGQVSFEAKARTRWHTHPAGQILLCTDGNGWYQERGKAARPLAKGDTVVIPKDVEHWHGAAKDNGFIHIAITNIRNGSGVTWLKPVSDEEYPE
jgi:quercetin dioxygenase-like cupin family protein/alkylhydroperoxidase/carboxymuconolactone decarboxylase family protein YurZ/quinol monooxygenase YgiN